MKHENQNRNQGQVLAAHIRFLRQELGLLLQGGGGLLQLLVIAPKQPCALDAVKISKNRVIRRARGRTFGKASLRIGIPGSAARAESGIGRAGFG